jgi:hypothetical protein
MKKQFGVKGRRPETVNGAWKAPHPIKRRAGCPAAQTNIKSGLKPRVKAIILSNTNAQATSNPALPHA